MKSEELTEKILNRVVYYLQGALEIQEDLLFDHLNELYKEKKNWKGKKTIACKQRLTK